MDGSRNASPSSSVTTGCDVFLSHSGFQKDFVEQLYENLKRARINVFFDKKSLPKGEEFPEHLRRAASTCKITVAVLSEDFFTRSSWPMAEIITSVEAKTPIIYPLFYLISSKGIKDVEKQQEWSAQWESWGMERHNMGVEQWKTTLKKIGITHGEEKHEFMSELEYRKKIGVCIKNMLEKINEKNVSGSVVPRGEPSRSGVVSRSRSGVVRSGNLTSRSGLVIRQRSGSVYSNNLPSRSEGSTSGAVVSRIATQPWNVVASSGSTGRQFGENLGVGLAVGIGVGVGQSVGVVLTETVQHYFSPAKEHRPSPSPPPPPSASPLPPPSASSLPPPPPSALPKHPKHSKHPCALRYREGTWHKNTNAGRCKFCRSPMKSFPTYFMCTRGLMLQPYGPQCHIDLIS